MQNKVYDLIIIGAGPAGLSASIYASRFKVDHLIIGSQPGGYMMETEIIENYPGYASITGAELSIKMKEHAESLGSKIIPEEADKIKKDGELFKIKTNLGNEYLSKFILYSIGTIPRKLDIPGEKELIGKGISYCATCDGPFYKEKNVVVVGGGNSAASAALILSQHAKKVTLFYRKEKLPALPSYQEQMKKTQKIKIVCCTNIKKVEGVGKVEKIILDEPYKGNSEFQTDGIFIEVGSEPKVSLAKKLDVELNEKDFIKTNNDQSTNIEGFYAAGDITTGSNGHRQIITAASEGAIAAINIFEKLK